MIIASMTRVCIITIGAVSTVAITRGRIADRLPQIPLALDPLPYVEFYERKDCKL